MCIDLPSKIFGPEASFLDYLFPITSRRFQSKESKYHSMGFEIQTEEYQEDSNDWNDDDLEMGKSSTDDESCDDVRTQAAYNDFCKIGGCIFSTYLFDS